MTITTAIIEDDADTRSLFAGWLHRAEGFGLVPAEMMYLGKPVIAINTATYWHALRTCGIHDKKAGFGSLLEHY